MAVDDGGGTSRCQGGTLAALSDVTAWRGRAVVTGGKDDGDLLLTPKGIASCSING